MEHKDLILTKGHNGCEGCYYKHSTDKVNGCNAQNEIWLQCIKNNRNTKCNNLIYTTKERMMKEKHFYETGDILAYVNEAFLGVRPKGFYKDLEPFTNRYVTNKIKAIWQNATKHKPNYDAYIPFEMDNGITYIAYYKQCKLIGLVMLEERALRRCFFVDFRYKELEVVQVEKEAIVFKVITKNRTVEFDNNKCKKKCYN